MRSLFWEIFVYFWIALVLSIVTTAWLTREMSTSDEIGNEIARNLTDAKSQALANFYSGGRDAVETWMMSNHRPPELFIYLFDENGKSRIERDVPRTFQGYLTDVLANGTKPGIDVIESSPAGLNRLFISGVEIVSMGSVNMYVLVGAIQVSGSGDLSDMNTLILRFVVSFIFVGLLCFALSRHLTRPLQMLQQSVRTFAKGNLETRVDRSLQDRKDEFGELGREFDVMAERIDGLVSGEKRMLRDISHELRSPIARMQVALELVREKSAEDNLEEIERIELEAERLNDLIAEILALVRFDMQEMNLQVEEIDLVRGLQMVIEDARYEGADITLDTDDIDHAMVNVNSKMLRSAFENIVRNALKFTTDKVEVCLRRKKHYELSVRDYGPGVDESDLAKIFEPFYRIEGSRDRRSGGYGLGLAIAKRSAKAHGGDIRASNANGGGLLVTITIPAIDQ
jgi:two-component system sensor histidine kinase CpxA